MSPPEQKKLAPEELKAMTEAFFHRMGIAACLPSAERSDAFSSLVLSLLSSAAASVSPVPRVSCVLSVSPASVNTYNTLHGGVVAAAAEAVGMACARAAVGDREMFLGELSTAYLAAARIHVLVLLYVSGVLRCTHHLHAWPPIVVLRLTRWDLAHLRTNADWSRSTAFMLVLQIPAPQG